jgi:hypothetical protein
VYSASSKLTLKKALLGEFAKMYNLSRNNVRLFTAHKIAKIPCPLSRHRLTTT